MSQYQIVVGSPRRDSFNRKLANAMVKLAPFDQAGNIGADSKKFLQDWMNHYVAWVKKHAA